MSRLKNCYEQLAGRLRQIGMPRWDSVWYIEDLNLDSGSIQSIDRYRFYALDEYLDRFETLAEEGHDWIKLSGLGLYRNTLIVAVEKSQSSSPGQASSINISGPPEFIEEDHFQLEKFLIIRC